MWLRLCFSNRRSILFVGTVESHDVTRVTSVAASNLRNPLCTELFIDAPSNKLFSRQGASKNSDDDGVFLPYKRADDFYETKCHGMAVTTRRGIVRFGCVSCDDDASTVVTTASRRKIARENKRHPRRISSKNALTHCVGFLQ